MVWFESLTVWDLVSITNFQFSQSWTDQLVDPVFVKKESVLECAICEGGSLINSRMLMEKSEMPLWSVLKKCRPTPSIFLLRLSLKT